MSFTANNQVGTAVAGGTTVTGLMTNLGITPETIGVVATLLGIILSVVLIYGHIKRIIIESADRKEREILSELSRKKAIIELEELRKRVEDPAQ